MNITNIKTRKLLFDGKMRAVVSVTFDDEIVVHDIKVIKGPDRYFLAMPSRKMPDGNFWDIVHPINAQVRASLERTILQYYHEVIATQAADDGAPAENDME